MGKYLVTDLATRRSQVVELASPVASAGDGPRVTKAASTGTGGSGTGGLSPAAAVIYRKLVARGMKPALARKFAAKAAMRAAKAKGTNMARDAGGLDLANTPKLGSGGRFRALVAKLMAKGHSRESAVRIAASIGRAKYGARGMGRLSHHQAPKGK